MREVTWTPPAPPLGYSMVRRSIDGAHYVRTLTGASVIVSATEELDGRAWVHFSMARADRLPTWEELVEGKEAFLGRESKAIMVLAPRSQWVNIHPNCLHLFVCLDGDVLPDFTHGSGSL